MSCGARTLPRGRVTACRCTSRACARALAEAGGDGGRLVSQAGGYLLEVQPGERDVDRWQQALDRARRARADGEPRAARDGDRGGARCLARPAARRE